MRSPTISFFTWTLAVLHFRHASANVEKVIFTAPDLSSMPSASPNLDSLCLEALSPTAATIQKDLDVVFRSEKYPRGLQSWYLLKGLKPGQRYEARVSWSATQPTAFNLTTHTISDAFEDEVLIAELGTYSESRQSSCETDYYGSTTEEDISTSLLFLVIDAAADYKSSDKSLMASPPKVKVDIVLDPYLLSVLPRSLAPTAAYVSCVTVAAYFVSGLLYRWISPPAPEKKVASKEKSKVS